MDKINIKFEDKTYTFASGTTLVEMTKSSKVPNIVAAIINNEIYSLDKKITNDCEITFINYNHLVGNKIYKSGLKFIFEVALLSNFPSLEVKFAHSVPRGMLGIIEGDKILTGDDISKIKKTMFEIIESDEKFEKLNVNPKDAIKYYKRINEDEKALNIQNINDKIVTIYKLKNKLNYFYSDMPYSTKTIDKFELVYLGNNRIVFLFPSSRSDGLVPEYVHYEKILSSFDAGKKWLDSLQVPNVTELNKIITNGEIKDFIRSNELMFSKELSKVADTLISNKDIKFVLISGPSSSGKTTSMARLATFLKASGYDPIKISLDDYFVNRTDTPTNEDGKYDFECLEAVDVEKVNKDLDDLLNGKEISLPTYNFITGKRELSNKIVKLNEKSIFLIEGLHALNEKIAPNIDAKYKYKIYLSPFIPLNIDRHNYISTIDLRLLRRIVRDNRTRGRDVANTIEIWQNVRYGEENYIFPYIHQADIIINTAMAYEVGVLKVFAEPLLYSVGVDSIYYEEARRLIDFLKQFFAIPGEYVNDDSILREFIGGKYND